MIVSVGAPEIIQGLLRLGGTVEVLNLRFASDGDACPAQAAELVVAPDLSVAELLDRVERVAPGQRLSGFVAVSDHHLSLASRLNEAAGTPGASPRTTVLMADKRAMRSALQATMAAPVRWRDVRGSGDATSFMQEIGGPIVLKPAAGSGSRRVFRIDAPDSAALAEFGEQMCQESGWIAEEFLEGPEFSVESFSFGGTHTVLGITEKVKDAHFVEIGHCFPARVDDDLADAVAGCVRTALEALELTDSVAHSEVIVTPAGPRLVETQGRVGGDRIGHLVELVTGIHPITRLAAALVGRALPEPAEQMVGAAAIRFVGAPSGVVASIHGVEKVRRWPGVREVELNVAVGDAIGPVTSSSDRVGYVLTTAPTSADASRVAAAAAAAIVITAA